MTGPTAGPWWEDEPERKLTGIVLPSWDDPADPDEDDDFDEPHRGRPAAASTAGSAPSAGGRPHPLTDPLTDPLTGPFHDPLGGLSTDPLHGPLGGGWRQETPLAAESRMVPVVPSGPPPAWPPVEPPVPARLPATEHQATGYQDTGYQDTGHQAVGHPGGWSEPSAFGEVPPEEQGSLVPSGQRQAAAEQRQAVAEPGPARREFPRYIAGELVLPGTADTTAPADHPQPAAHPAAQADAHPAVHPGARPGTDPGAQPDVHAGTRPGTYPGAQPDAHPRAATAELPAKTLAPATWAPQPTAAPPAYPPPAGDRAATLPPLPTTPAHDPLSGSLAGPLSDSLGGLLGGPTDDPLGGPLGGPIGGPIGGPFGGPLGESRPARGGPGRDGALPALPGVQFTAPPKVTPALSEAPTAPVHLPPPSPQTPPPPAVPAATMTRPTGPHLAKEPPAMSAATVPPPPRPTPPSIPPAAVVTTAHPAGPATQPTATGMLPATPQPTATAILPAVTQPTATAMLPAVTQPTATAMLPAMVQPAVPQPAVPAAVHAAQQGAANAPHEDAAADGPPAPVPPPKGRKDGALHPAFHDAAARTMRILPIAADLLPLEITDLRRMRRVRKLVIAGVAVFAALLLGWYGTAVNGTIDAQADLDSVQDMTRDLGRKQAQYNDLVKTRQQSKQITEQLRVVLVRDLSWSTLLTSLQRAAPKNVQVRSVTGALSVQDTSATATATDVIGLVTLTGTAPSKKEVAAYVDTLGGVTGIANPFPTDATEGDDGLNFTIRVDITKAAVGGRFTSPSAVPSAAGGK